MSPVQGTSQQLLRSPPSPGESPDSKRQRASPDPAPLARETIKWIRYTIEVATTKKSSMTVETQRTLFEKLRVLDAAVHDMVMSNLQLSSKLEEARRSAELCVGAAAAQFGTELRLREAAHEQTLEAIVTRFAEKEAIRAQEAALAEVRGPPPQARVEAQEIETMATVTRRRKNRSSDRKGDRSRSRAAQRNKKIKEGKQAENMPSFILQECQGKTATDVRDMIWNQVVAKKIRPKCQTVTTKTGKVILKPTDRDTSDALKHISRVSIKRIVFVGHV